MLFTLFLFDFFALCLPRKVQLSVVTVFSDIESVLLQTETKPNAIRFNGRFAMDFNQEQY